jgi:PAS domain S-box-containing protein
LDEAKAQTLTISNWYDNLTDDLYKEAVKVHKAFTSIVIGIGLVDMVLFGILIWGFSLVILKPLKTIETNTQGHQHSNGFYKNEIKQVADQINEVIEQLRDATDFVKGIGEGKLDMDYKAELDQNYVGGNNKLADELISMQSKLRTLNIEEQQRTWSNEGLTKFVDILRNASDNLHALGDKIIANLVQYTKANQGALYILNDDDEHNKYLELISMFAFDIKKFEAQRIKLGQGILGQTFLEKQTTYLTDFPADYIRITSGLGEAGPQALLLVPLKVDTEVYGIVELASFKEFQPHEISFVERLGETIASTLSSVKINQKNRKLLEQFQEQTEQMRAQEEEMRQNMEELTATQEGMHRLIKEAQDKEAYLNSLMDASPDAIAAIDREYKVVYRNRAPLFEKFLSQGIRYEKGYYVLGLFKKDEFDYHKNLYDKAFAGETVTVTKDYFGRQYSIAYNPIRLATGEAIGVSIFAHDVTELEQLKAELAEKDGFYTDRINVLEADLKNALTDERWKLAAELENTFRIQLEALSLMKKPNA